MPAKKFSVILICALLLSMASSAFGWDGRVKADILNVRAKPSIKARIIGKLQNNDYVDVDRQQKDKTGRLWYYVYFQDGVTTIDGWAAAEYIVKD